MDRMTESRNHVNSIINICKLTDETILKIVDKPEAIFDAGMLILKEYGDCEDAIDFYKDFERYLKMSPIEKFHFDFIISTVSQLATGVKFLDMLLAKVALFAKQQ